MWFRKAVLTVISVSVFIFLMSNGVFAQPCGTISGLLVDSENKKPLFRMSIYLRSDSSMSVTPTDNQGKFLIPNIPSGIYKIHVGDYHHNYKSVDLENIEVVCTDTTKVYIEMTPTHYGKITGRVIDAKTEDPIVSANIILKDSELPTGAATNVDGVYVMIGIPPGNYKMIFVMIGYNSIELSDVAVTLDETTTVDMQMMQIDADSITFHESWRKD